MSQYLMILTPQEPYFLGNEKTFLYPGQDEAKSAKRYYITGECVPSQTTLIGALRYILLPNKKTYDQYTPSDIAANNAVVGERSFQYGQNNSFGKIKQLSPLFLVRGDEKFVVTPFDHIVGQKQYTPFSEYAEANNGAFIYPTQYKAKEGISQSYMRVSDGELYEASDIFSVDARIGINRSATDSGFFKKEYRILKEGFSFATYVTLDDDITPKNTIVFLGQGKSLFTADFIKVADDADKQLEKEISAKLRSNIIYCFSDVFITSDIYADTRFAITDLKEYRTYTTNYTQKETTPTFYKSIEKGTSLYKLIRAGSIFIPHSEKFMEKFNDQNVQIIGFNMLLRGTEEGK